jgi:hypothetical protein
MNKSSSNNNQVRMVDVVDVKAQEVFAAEKRRSEVSPVNPYPSSRPRTNGVPVAVPTSSASAYGHSLPVAGQSMGEAAGFQIIHLGLSLCQWWMHQRKEPVLNPGN